MIANPSIDTKDIVMGGFSMGARQALTIGLSRAIPVAGIIAVVPGLSDGIQYLQQYLVAQEEHNLRVCLIVGEQDHPEYTLAPTRELAKMLDAYGVACQLLTVPELGHAFPENFPVILQQCLSWIVDELV